MAEQMCVWGVSVYLVVQSPSAGSFSPEGAASDMEEPLTEIPPVSEL